MTSHAKFLGDFLLSQYLDNWFWKKIFITPQHHYNLKSQTQLIQLLLHIDRQIYRLASCYYNRISKFIYWQQLYHHIPKKIIINYFWLLKIMHNNIFSYIFILICHCQKYWKSKVEQKIPILWGLKPCHKSCKSSWSRIVIYRLVL